jgi:hypothetical protein
MIQTSQALVCLALLPPPQVAAGGQNQSGLTDYQKLHRALTTKTLRAGAAVGKMLDLGVPTWRRKLGRFTEYDYELLPGYHGLRLLAKDGRLRQAIQYDCTHPGTFFDELTAQEARQYRALRERNEHVPPERCMGRWGWHRPPRRLWDRDPGVPARGR